MSILAYSSILIAKLTARPISQRYRKHPRGPPFEGSSKIECWRATAVEYIKSNQIKSNQIILRAQQLFLASHLSNYFLLPIQKLFPTFSSNIKNLRSIRKKQKNIVRGQREWEREGGGKRSKKKYNGKEEEEREVWKNWDKHLRGMIRNEGTFCIQDFHRLKTIAGWFPHRL